MFQRWIWLNENEFREFYGYTDQDQYPVWVIRKAIIYGCYRVSKESGHVIRDSLGEKPFPGDLTKKQRESVVEMASWSANHMVKQGLDWIRGSQSVSLGQISTGQTNPEQPDYLPPFIHEELVSVGLMRNIQTSSLEVEDDSDFGDSINCDPEKVNPVTWDDMKRMYLSKKGGNSVTSTDGTISVKPSGGVYGGIDLRISKLLLDPEEIKKRIREVTDKVRTDLEIELRNNLDEFEKGLNKKVGESLKKFGDGLKKVKEGVENWVKKHVSEEIENSYPSLRDKIIKYIVNDEVFPRLDASKLFANYITTRIITTSSVLANLLETDNLIVGEVNVPRAISNLETRLNDVDTRLKKIEDAGGSWEIIKSPEFQWDEDGKWYYDWKGEVENALVTLSPDSSTSIAGWNKGGALKMELGMNYSNYVTSVIKRYGKPEYPPGPGNPPVRFTMLFRKVYVRRAMHPDSSPSLYNKIFFEWVEFRPHSQKGDLQETVNKLGERVQTEKKMKLLQDKDKKEKKEEKDD